MTQKYTTLFDRLLLRQKFAILGGLAIILVGVAFYSVVSDQWHKITVTQREQQGLKLANELLALTQLLSKHRAYSVGFISYDATTDSKAIKKAIGQHIDDFAGLNQDNGDILKQWETVKEEWPRIAKKATDHSVSPLEMFRLDTWLIAKVREALNLVIGHYGLSLDPYPESYFLIRSLLVDGPMIAEYLDQANGWGTGLLLQAAEQAEKKIGLTSLQNTTISSDRGRLMAMLSIANEHLDNAEQNFNNFLQADGKHADQERQASMDSQFNTTTALIRQAIELADTEIITNPKPDYPAMDYYMRHNLAIHEIYNEINNGIAELDGIFSRQIQAAGGMLLILSLVILALIAVCTLVSLYIVTSITHPVSFLVGIMQKLAAGDNSVRANIETSDEIGILGRQFDLMIDQRETVRLGIEHENERLNNSVVDLLMSVAKLAQKDLTVRAVVPEDVTGAVADALNLLSEEIARVLRRVAQIADEVADVSQQVQGQSAVVIDVATQEKYEVEQAARELATASQAMLEIARLATACNQAATQAINNTDKAQESVLDTINGITAIRSTIHETEKRIKRLGERSQEIGGVVKLIDGIAERTHILAINAAMSAASAGEAGRSFAVVASEVQKLAGNAREATSKIAALVNSIQTETAETVITMNNAISQVVRGTELAQQAGGEMRETRDTTANLVELVQTIAASSTNQSDVSIRLVNRAKQIQGRTEETYTQLQNQSIQTKLLVELSGLQVSTVGVFTLPEAG